MRALCEGRSRLEERKATGTPVPPRLACTACMTERELSVLSRLIVELNGVLTVYDIRLTALFASL